ncbi:Xyloglucan endotransglucosylase/hydrolase 2 [Linum grandiflorum]
MVMMLMLMQQTEAGNFNEDVDITWGGERAQIKDGGNLISLSLDRDSGSGFQSKSDYMFARIDLQLKLVPRDAAGVVTAYYVRVGPIHDEIDFEFLGNVSGQPYTLHTNVYTHGQGNREQQFFLWFDPTRNFHTYSIIWKPQHIIFLVDHTPIRVFRNLRKYGVPYPRKQPMKLYCSIWDADNWATRGGLVKTDWSMAPFTTPYTNFAHNGRGKFREAGDPDIDPYARKRLRWVEKYFMVYNYCTDFNRFQGRLPPECRHSRVL